MSSHHIDQKPRSWRALLTRRSYRRPSFREDHDDTLPNACASPRPNSSSSSPTRHPTANYSCSQNKRPDFRFQKAKYLAMCIRCPQQWFRPNDGNRNFAYVTHWTNSLKTKLTMRPDSPENMCRCHNGTELPLSACWSFIGNNIRPQTRDREREGKGKRR